ncbi:hypothetical protein ACR921_18560, partial [Klebsiella pneumoniae]
MDAIFDRVVREFFPNTTIPFWGNDSNLLIVFYVQIVPDD